MTKWVYYDCPLCGAENKVIDTAESFICCNCKKTISTRKKSLPIEESVDKAKTRYPETQVSVCIVLISLFACVATYFFYKAYDAYSLLRDITASAATMWVILGSTCILIGVLLAIIATLFSTHGMKK